MELERFLADHASSEMDRELVYVAISLDRLGSQANRTCFYWPSPAHASPPGHLPAIRSRTWEMTGTLSIAPSASTQMAAAWQATARTAWRAAGEGEAEAAVWARRVVK